MLEGTVVNGAIVLDGSPALPEGARVAVELLEDDDLGDFVPPPTETYEEYIAALRQSIADMEAGERGVSVDEAFDELDRYLARPVARKE